MSFAGRGHEKDRIGNENDRTWECAVRGEGNEKSRTWNKNGRTRNDRLLLQP
jgi:hypothetical protein